MPGGLVLRIARGSHLLSEEELEMDSGSAELRRSDDRVIAGVCGGLAQRFGWSATRVRIAYVLISVLSAAFPGILVYLVLWFVMPDARE
jgi:phage shock protein PspC (stress-responsive transcriptional regulator)